ncbi:MAG TPA: energy transducer TonB [Candidatus Acidoferrum sp.]
MMIADPPTSGTRLGVGFDGGRSRSRNDHWRTAIGTKPVPARFELLPDGEKRWDRIGLSAIVQISLLTFFVVMPIFFPERLEALRYSVVPLFMPVTEIPVAPPPPPPPKVKVAKAPEPKPIEPPKLSPKQPHIFVQQKAFRPNIRQLEVKAPELTTQTVFEAKLNTPINGPKRPKDEVKVNTLGTGSAAPATVNAPINKVQTGGFGDPNGLPGKGNPNKTTNINRLGSPALPGGDGYGNGTGGAKGIRGTVASTGFGNGVANPPPSGGKRGTVQSGGFADATVADNTPKKKAASSDSPTTMVDILDKPRPQYTAEGRTLRLEGDVVLDMVFQANGTVQVNQVISGLGHGLDESAVRAAQQIKFKPAKRDGQPVDFPARVRIEFRLAY